MNEHLGPAHGLAPRRADRGSVSVSPVTQSHLKTSEPVNTTSLEACVAHGRVACELRLAEART